MSAITKFQQYCNQNKYEFYSMIHEKFIIKCYQIVANLLC